MGSRVVFNNNTTVVGRRLYKTSREQRSAAVLYIRIRRGTFIIYFYSIIFQPSVFGRR